MVNRFREYIPHKNRATIEALRREALANQVGAEYAHYNDVLGVTSIEDEALNERGRADLGRITNEFLERRPRPPKNNAPYGFRLRIID